MVAYSLPGGSLRTLQDHYALNFKTLEKDGVLLYSEGIQGDSVLLELKTGRLYLHMSLGKERSKATAMCFEEKKSIVLMIPLFDFTGSSTVHNVDGMTTVRLGNLLDTQHWHYVTIKRYGRELNFTLDSQKETVLLNGEFTYLDLDNQVSHLQNGKLIL